MNSAIWFLAAVAGAAIVIGLFTLIPGHKPKTPHSHKK